MEHKDRIIYLSHGGGPLPLLGDPAHGHMVRFTRELGATLRRPKAILVISAHWEEALATVTSSPHPALIYDYSGFPPESYRLSYPAPGCPELARRVVEQLRRQGLEAREDAERGVDHGHFVPLMLMFPQADIPAFQLSLLSSLDPEAHLALGRALRPLLEEDLLVIGSGFSFHNLRAFFRQQPGSPDRENEAFQDWLIANCTQPDPQEAERGLAAWEQAPGARYCHPREDHLLPLHVCQAMAGRPARVIFDAPILGKRSLAFGW